MNTTLRSEEKFNTWIKLIKDQIESIENYVEAQKELYQYKVAALTQEELSNFKSLLEWLEHFKCSVYLGD